MARSRHRAPRRGPDRFTQFGGAVLITMYLADVIKYAVTGDPQQAATTGLGMLGFIAVCLIAGFSRPNRHTEQDHQRLSVIVFKAIGILTIGLVAHAVWAPQVTGIPAQVALVGVGLVLLAGDAALVALRGRQART